MKWIVPGEFLMRMVRLQEEILKFTKVITQRMAAMASSLEVLKAYAAQIDEATTAIALRIEALLEKVAQGTVTAEEIAEVLQPEIESLKGLGKEE